MRVGLVVDSACDLPPQVLEDHKILVLPIDIRVGKQTFVDRRDLDETLAFYRDHLSNQGDGESIPYSVTQIKDLFLERLVVDYDFVFCLAIASSRSPIFEHAQRASFSILSEYKPIRERAGVTGPFSLRVIDTQNLFVGEGVVTLEAARLIADGASPQAIRERLEALIPQVYAYMLPNDLYHLRARASKKGEKSIGWVKYAVGSALDIKPLVRGFQNETHPVTNLRHFDEGVRRCFRFMGNRIRKGLVTPNLVISYSGDPRRVEEMPGFEQMCDIAANAGVKVHVCVMSMTGGINVGEGALAFGFAAPEHEFDA